MQPESAFAVLTGKNALLYAVHAYDNPQCLSTSEFVEDFKRLKYVKRLCRRYDATGQISERLMLNHLMLLVNVFGSVATVRLLFLRCHEENLYHILKPFLRYLNVLPDVVPGINGADIYTESIPSDAAIEARLQDV
jgi:hypothetical protein